MGAAIPAETLSTHRATVEAGLRDLRSTFSAQLNDCIKEGLDALPKSLHGVSLREFLLLETFVSGLKADAPPPHSPPRSSKKRSTAMVADSSRRVTRSMARASSIAPADHRHSAVPSTPRLHPLLPETPAMLRKAIKLAKDAEDEHRVHDDFKRPVRIARSSIRVVKGGDHNANVFKQPAAPRRSTRQSAIKRRRVEGEEEEGESTANPQLDSTVVSLELSDGKVLDVDLSQSPKSMLNGLGSDAVKEVKSKMKSYAAQLRAFFKKLNF